jgi:hypothetical protein
MRWTTKTLICIEAIVCFAPVVLLLLLGVLLVPIQFVAINHEPLLWRDSASLLGSVACGAIGLATLLFLLGTLFFGRKPIGSPVLVCTGVALGALPIVPIAVFGDQWGWKLVGALPLAAAAHILYLSRRYLFSSWRHAAGSIIAAAAVVSLLHALVTFDPFQASERVLGAHLARWEASAPDSYEYTVRVNGWLPPEALSPKRIVVEKGKVVAATYAQAGAGRRVGDAAPLDELWTIEHAFAQLLAAEEAGGTVTARFDLRWGFAERAFVESEDERSGWDIEVTEFNVLREAAKPPAAPY